MIQGLVATWATISYDKSGTVEYLILFALSWKDCLPLSMLLPLSARFLIILLLHLCVKSNTFTVISDYTFHQPVVDCYTIDDDTRPVASILN